MEVLRIQVFVQILIFAALSFCHYGCTQSTDPASHTNSVEISNPQDGSNVTGTVDITVPEHDVFKAAFVEFYIDDEMVLMDIQHPWHYEWQTTAIADNEHHSIYAIYFDIDGISHQTPDIEVTVNRLPLLKTVQGHVYFQNSQVQIEDAVVTANGRSDTTDAEGFFSFENIQFGIHQISAEKENFNSQQLPLEVDEFLHSLTIELTSDLMTSRISGYITETYTDTYVVGAEVTMLNPTGTVSNITTVTDQNGQFQLNNVPNGTRRIKIGCENFLDQEMHVFLDGDLELNGSITNIGEVISDNEGNEYSIVQIGHQRWMTENLSTAVYENGDSIIHQFDTHSWINTDQGAYCNYGYYSTHVETYGRLYNFAAVADERNICPAGWHVPSDDEFLELEMFLGMSEGQAQNSDWRGTGEGGFLKELGYDHWDEPNTGALDQFGFSALPAGLRRGYDGRYDDLGDLSGYFWTRTSRTDSTGYFRKLSFDEARIKRNAIDKNYGFSVRCIEN